MNDEILEAFRFYEGAYGTREELIRDLGVECNCQDCDICGLQQRYSTFRKSYRQKGAAGSKRRSVVRKRS